MESPRTGILVPLLEATHDGNGPQRARHEYVGRSQEYNLRQLARSLNSCRSQLTLRSAHHASLSCATHVVRCQPHINKYKFRGYCVCSPSDTSTQGVRPSPPYFRKPISPWHQIFLSSPSILLVCCTWHLIDLAVTAEKGHHLSALRVIAALATTPSHWRMLERPFRVPSAHGMCQPL